MTPAQAADALSFQSIAALRRLAAGKRPYPKQRTKLAKTGCMTGDFITPFGRAVLAECDAINQGSKEHGLMDRGGRLQSQCLVEPGV
jgi:hypothetical protein